MNISTFTAFPDSVTNRSEPATTRGHGLGATARLTLLMRNGKGGRVSVSWRDLPLIGAFCADPEMPGGEAGRGREADEAVEVIGELALGREASAGSELRQRTPSTGSVREPAASVQAFQLGGHASTENTGPAPAGVLTAGRAPR